MAPGSQKCSGTSADLLIAPTSSSATPTPATAPVGGAATRVLHRPDAAIVEVLTSLLNELSGAAGDVVLVLDDLHLSRSAEVHESLAFFVDHLPPRAHVVITTRSDPPLPLARLRARGQLLEIRAADLRFTNEEAAAYLGGSMGLDLGDRGIADEIVVHVEPVSRGHDPRILAIW